MTTANSQPSEGSIEAWSKLSEELKAKMVDMSRDPRIQLTSTMKGAIGALSLHELLEKEEVTNFTQLDTPKNNPPKEQQGINPPDVPAEMRVLLEQLGALYDVPPDELQRRVGFVRDFLNRQDGSTTNQSE